MSGYSLVVRVEKADEGRAAVGRRCVEDAAGGRKTFAYDVDNPLVPVKCAAGAVATCTYNALQQRVGRDAASVPLNLPRGGLVTQRSTEGGVRRADTNRGRRRECRLNGAVSELKPLVAEPHT